MTPAGTINVMLKVFTPFTLRNVHHPMGLATVATATVPGAVHLYHPDKGAVVLAMSGGHTIRFKAPISTRLGQPPRRVHPTAHKRNIGHTKHASWSDV